MTEKSCPFCEGIVEVYTLKGEETRLYSSCLDCGMLTTGDINSNKRTENQDKNNSEEFRRYQVSKKLRTRKGKGMKAKTRGFEWVKKSKQKNNRDDKGSKTYY